MDRCHRWDRRNTWIPYVVSNQPRWSGWWSISMRTNSHPSRPSLSRSPEWNWPRNPLTLLLYLEIDVTCRRVIGAGKLSWRMGAVDHDRGRPLPSTTCPAPQQRASPAPGLLASAISMDATPRIAPVVPLGVHMAFESLYAQEAEHIYRTIYGIVLDGGVAHGLTQETFACAFEDCDGSNRPDPRAELLQIATTLAIADEEERHSRAPSSTSREVGTRSGSDTSRDRDDVVCWLMRPLTADQRALIVLHLYQQVPVADVAELLGLAVGTVPPRVSTAMQVLHQRALVWQSAVPSFRRGMASTGYYDPSADLNTQIIDALTDGLDAVAVTLPTLDEALDRARRESPNHREGRAFPKVFVAAAALVVVGAVALAAARIGHVGTGPTQQAESSPPISGQSAAPSVAPSASGTPAVTNAPPTPPAGAPPTPPAAPTRVTATAAAQAPATPAQPSSSTPPPTSASQRPTSAPTASTTTSRSTSTPQSQQAGGPLPTCGLLGVGCP